MFNKIKKISRKTTIQYGGFFWLKTNNIMQYNNTERKYNR